MVFPDSSDLTSVVLSFETTVFGDDFTSTDHLLQAFSLLRHVLMTQSPKKYR